MVLDNPADPEHALDGSQLVIVAQIGHMSTIEQPATVTAALEQHFART